VCRIECGYCGVREYTCVSVYMRVQSMKFANMNSSAHLYFSFLTLAHTTTHQQHTPSTGVSARDAVDNLVRREGARLLEHLQLDPFLDPLALVSACV
jgi:hypothetical protein